MSPLLLRHFARWSSAIRLSLASIDVSSWLLFADFSAVTDWLKHVFCLGRSSVLSTWHSSLPANCFLP